MLSSDTATWLEGARLKGSTTREEMAEWINELELPDGFEPFIALAVGYPEKELENNPKQHSPISVNFIK